LVLFPQEVVSGSDLSRAFLVIAPNIIVFERLREDFENGKIFKEWDLIPPEWQHDWQMSFILRGESRKTTTEGTLYLTNIHQLYEDKENSIPQNPVSRLLGPKPKDATGSWEEDMLERVRKHGELIIINDEAHHVHDTELEWYKVILNLHKNLKEKFGNRLSLQLDFTATPKDQNGTFFPWIVCDYPLAQAIEDRIVKAPLIVHKTDQSDPESTPRPALPMRSGSTSPFPAGRSISRPITRSASGPCCLSWRKTRETPMTFSISCKERQNSRGRDNSSSSIRTRPAR